MGDQSARPNIAHSQRRHAVPTFGMPNTRRPLCDRGKSYFGGKPFGKEGGKGKKKEKGPSKQLVKKVDSIFPFFFSYLDNFLIKRLQTCTAVAKPYNRPTKSCLRRHQSKNSNDGTRSARTSREGVGHLRFSARWSVRP